MWRLLSMVGLLVLAACAGRAPAPVVDRAGPTTVVEAGVGAAVATGAAPGAAVAAAREGYYTVKKGDTLYRIALDHGQDHKDIAAWNNLPDAGRIEVGQQLRVAPPEGAVVVKPVTAPGAVVLVPEGGRPASVAPAADGRLKREPLGGKVAYSDQALAQVRALEGGAVAAASADKPADKPVPVPAVAPPVAAVDADGIEWAWPVPGKVLTQFVEGAAGKESNKGVDLAARIGEPVQAAAAGKVVYVGNSLRGYGNLVIVRHNAAYLSAYAHNSRILVKEGQSVNRAQKIAEAGNSDADQPKLHFEIRRQGKPVDPLKHLPPR